MNQLNRKLAPDIESVYVMASPEYSFLSSTGVKELATFGGDVSDLVPDSVAAKLAERIERTLRPRCGLSNGQQLANHPGANGRRTGISLLIPNLYAHSWTYSY